MVNIEKAAFSKSVNCSSIVRNSTRHPMSVPGGGNLNRIEFQLVDCSTAQMLTKATD
eukprot:SAG31_NODE_955_length_10799_cov_6.576636_12_plen_57_part_00